MPLGQTYSGTCRANPDEFHVPSETHLRDVCNCGYARGVCDRFPAGDAADAVRFSATEAGDGRLSVIYVFEKDHAPAGHGSLDFSIAANAFLSQGDELLLRQARAFVESLLRAG